MFSATQAFPVYLQGFGQTSQDVISVFQPIADVVQEYFELQTKQAQVQVPSTKQASIIPSVVGISPIYLIAGGVLAWFLLRKKSEVKNKKKS